MIMTTLLSGCKSKQAESNPLLETWSTPFGVPPFDKIKTEHFKPAVEAGIRLHEAQIDSIVKNTETPSFGNVIEALDRSGEVLNNAYTVFSLLNSAESNDRMQADDMEISPLVSAHNDNIYLNDRLFQKVKAVYDQRRGRREAVRDGKRKRTLHHGGVLDSFPASVHKIAGNASSR